MSQVDQGDTVTNSSIWAKIIFNRKSAKRESHQENNVIHCTKADIYGVITGGRWLHCVIDCFVTSTAVLRIHPSSLIALM